jgi:hypothetical protein
VEVSSISARSENGDSVSESGVTACVGVPFPLLRIFEKVSGDFPGVGGALMDVLGVIGEMDGRGDMEGRGDRVSGFLSPLLPLLMFAAMVPSKKCVSCSTCLRERGRGRGIEGDGEKDGRWKIVSEQEGGKEESKDGEG